jgi:hypothetical protein
MMHRASEASSKHLHSQWCTVVQSTQLGVYRIVRLREQ